MTTKTVELTSDEVSNILDSINTMNDLELLGEWKSRDLESLDRGYQKLMALELQFAMEEVND